MNEHPKNIGVGIIGLGFMGATHIRAYQSARCELRAVCDRRKNRRDGFLNDVGGNIDTGAVRERAFDPTVVRGYENASELFADPSIDLVSICTPTDTHAELAIAALRAGKHVLCEKPVSLHVEEIREIESVSREMNRICMPAMCMRFWPGWSWLKDRIDDQELGKCRSFKLTRLGAAPTWSTEFYNDPARTGGALVDLHIHDTDFVFHCFGKPKSVQSTGTINHVTTKYEFDDVQNIAAEGGWLAPGTQFQMRYHARFERAAVDFDISRDSKLLLTRDGDPEPVHLETLSGYDLEIRHLLEVMTSSGSVQPRATLRDAIAVAELLDAERASLYKPATR